MLFIWVSFEKKNGIFDGKLHIWREIGVFLFSRQKHATNFDYTICNINI